MTMTGQKSASHRGQRTLKLLSSLEGEGFIQAGDAKADVIYRLDTFEERNRRSVGGDLEGDLSFAEDKSPAVLHLATGEAVKVILIKPDQDGADFQGA